MLHSLLGELMIKRFLLVSVSALCAGAIATPQFAREYKLACADCHTQPPKLNLRGQQFADSNYRSLKMKDGEALAIALWVSGLAQSVASDPKAIRSVPSRVELISAGRDKKFSYFVEWRAVSREILSSGAIRDRSGRFEDLFLIYELNSRTHFQVGQFRALSQIDVSRRLNLAEPTAFATSLPGHSGSNSRITSLRGFSLSGRSPSLRISHEIEDGANAVLTIPFPGEFSIPLTSEARSTASFEFESNAKGVFLELFSKRDLQSFGTHVFIGNNRRYLIGTAGQFDCENLTFEGGLSFASADGKSEWRLSAGVDWIPRFMTAFGARLDFRDSPGFKPMFSPYASFCLPMGETATKLIVEGRFQEKRYPQILLEFSWMF